MYKINFTPREYQENIYKTCIENNTLVVLPTGMGKTKLAIMVAIERLNKFPNSKILFCTPTKPLATQIAREFKEETNIETIELLTGTITPKKREQLWKKANVIVATPQTIQSDLAKERLSLEEFSLVIIDEAHRSRMKFANTIVAGRYLETNSNSKILGLTASPGNSKAQIEEICTNLGIENVEIRTEEDEDVKKHVQEKEVSIVKVTLPQEFIQIRDILKKIYQSKLPELHKIGCKRPLNSINKRYLLEMQIRLQAGIRKRNPLAFYGVSLIAQLIKLDHAISLIETQGVNPLNDFFNKMRKETTKASKNLFSMEAFKRAVIKTEILIKKEAKHPKSIKLLELINKNIENKDSRIIVFANFRNTVSELVKLLKENNISCKRFVGQAHRKEKGLTQKDQANIIQDFRDSKFNVLVASSVGEEGLDIPEVKAVIFYEAVPSELRRIQRAGRTGRTKPGKIISLLTKDSRDEAYYWAAYNKEKKMKRTLYGIKNKVEKQSKLFQ